jgi:hypothetical protein
MSQDQELTPEDVTWLVNAHGGFSEVPAALHVRLCDKLVNGVLDGGASFYLAENEAEDKAGVERGLCVYSLEALEPMGNVWLCEHVLSFKNEVELKTALVCEPENRERLRGLTRNDPQSVLELSNELMAHHSHELRGSKPGASQLWHRKCMKT